MELRNDFRVAAPIDEVWTVLTDVERIAPCLPGAELQEVDGDEYRGVVRVKVGPITAQYKGAAHFLERDDADRRAVLRAEGRETRGQGNASATITAQLQSDGAGTHVEVVTDLMITGRVAQLHQAQGVADESRPPDVLRRAATHLHRGSFPNRGAQPCAWLARRACGCESAPRR